MVYTEWTWYSIPSDVVQNTLFDDLVCLFDDTVLTFDGIVGGSTAWSIDI